MDELKEVLGTNQSLDILIDIYNSELKYLTLMKNAFEIYGHPLRYI